MISNSVAPALARRVAPALRNPWGVQWGETRCLALIVEPVPEGLGLIGAVARMRHEEHAGLWNQR